jgi:hypothetical protein
MMTALSGNVWSAWISGMYPSTNGNGGGAL